jgi:DNA polymerase
MVKATAKDEILAHLEWFRAMGVDAAVSDLPIDWLSRPERPPGGEFQWPDREQETRPSSPPQAASRPLSQPVPNQGPPSQPTLATPRPQTRLAASEADSEARRLAKGATTLGELQAALAAFEGCTLKATAKNLCFYRGAPNARLMLIGEAPGRDEDIEGKPFVGRAGQLLDKMLAAIGLSDADFHITNIVYWRPPGNRTPTPQEAIACRPFLERQIELVAPDIIVALGGTAAKDVLGVAEGIMRLRGKWRQSALGGTSIPALATLDPAYLLRTPAAKQMAWQDLLQIRSRLLAKS